MLGNTNGSSFELFALIGEMYGKGLPLAYILICSDGNGGCGAKEHLLQQFLGRIKSKYMLKAVFTGSNKDLSKIAALCGTFGSAKHLLCYWHCIHAVKTHLSVL